MSTMSRGLPWVRWVIISCLYLGGGVIATAGISHPGLLHERFGLIPMVEGQAYNPYARRVLAPTLIRGIRLAMPAFVRAAAEKRGRAMGGSSTDSPTGTSEDGAKRIEMDGNWDYAVAGAILNVFSYSAFLLLIRGLMLALFRPPALLADLFPLVVLISVPVLGQYSTTAYDHLQLCLFTLGLWLIQQRRDRALLLFLPIGMLNKETTILLPLVYLVTNWQSSARRTVIFQVATQMAICLAVFAATVVACRHHPGGVAESHLGDTLRTILVPANYFRFARIEPSPLLPGGANLPVPTGWNVPALLVLIALIAPGWNQAPTLIRKGIPAVFVPLLLLALFLGMWSELRDYQEVLPLLVLAVYSGVQGTLGRRSDRRGAGLS
jgi:hypothetical protein